MPARKKTAKRSAPSSIRRHKSNISPSRARSGGRLAAIIGAALTLAACGNHLGVRTATMPDARFAGRTTFRVLRVPAHTGGIPLKSDDPMLEQSPAYEALRDEVGKAFEGRGYRVVAQGADLDIAYYATAAPVLDLHTFDYGYDWRNVPSLRGGGYEYANGTVVIDVVDPATRTLLWRGEAKLPTPTYVTTYAVALRETVRAIVKRYPTREAND